MSLAPSGVPVGEAPLKVALIDPASFTIPYDAKLGRALAGLGHEVLLYGKAAAPGDIEEEPEELRGIFYPELVRLRAEIWPKRAARLAKGIFHLGGMRRLVGRLRAERPDVIHFQWLPLPLVDRLFLPALRRLAPLVVTAHDSRPFNSNPSSAVQGLGATSILREFDRVIVHTEEARGRLVACGVAPSRLARLAHGILHDELPAPPETPASDDGVVRFLLFGKVKPYKGADLLIEAFGRLPPVLRAKAELSIIGEPHMEVAPLREAAAVLGDRVRLDFRFVPDAELAHLFARADVIVFPYREIDVSGVLMAALNQHRPIIASRIGGFAELLVDDEHGILVPPGDVAALAAALRRLCEEPHTRHRMGQSVAALAGAVPSWEEIALATTRLYRELRSPL
jgi:glycosyltransferase involved in cell wall biosynthesis